ncbi:MAG: hypothetical protein J0M04_24805, partial [Verrucomicrobia bacterium]|nr:hypothetical protein [Verrucomicrobiota bacterium]
SGFVRPVPKAASAEPEPPAPTAVALARAVHRLKTAAEDARAEADRHETGFLAHVGKAALLARETDWGGAAADFLADPGAFCGDWVVRKVAEFSGTEPSAPRSRGYLSGPDAGSGLLGHLKAASAALRGLVSNLEAGEIADGIAHAVKTAATPLPPGDGGRGGKDGNKDRDRGKDKPAGEVPEKLWKFINELPDKLPYRGREESVAEGINGIYADAGKWGFERSRARTPGAVAKLSPEEEGEQLVRRRIFLKLTTGDEILSRVDPAEVARHYNTLSRIAPEVSLVPEASRSFLRNMVHSGGGIDLFAVEQAGKATGALQKAVRPGERSANPAIGEIRDRQMAGAR